MQIPFDKFCGAGNDFIIIDNRRQILAFKSLSRFIVRICCRRLSVGADGVIIIEDSDQADFKWHFYNKDGSRAQMCGNGARCAALYAVLNKISAQQVKFETDIGIINAEVDHDHVKVQMNPPTDIKLDFDLSIDDQIHHASSINTGVPHLVLFNKKDNIVSLGRRLRFHSEFAPAGTNVNFVCDHPDGILNRTYERGVENETLACGTGAVAVAIIAHLKMGMEPPIKVQTKSGSPLTISFKQVRDRFEDVFLEGPAGLIYKGMLMEKAVVYLSIGSNMGDKGANCSAAIKALHLLPDTRVTKQSQLYSTEPVDYTDQEWFVNCVVEIKTGLEPLKLLEKLNNIEAQAGRVRKNTVRYGPRTLDLDILIYDDLIMKTPKLTIPHGRMHQRPFILKLICNLVPDLIHPVLKEDMLTIFNRLDCNQNMELYQCDS